jgi:Ran GTPase-activating protein (RanGAP) involved in mRNA processing and transport
MPIDDDILQRLCDNDTTLTELDLAGYKIEDEGTKALAAGLEKNTTLTSLSLGWNEISNEGAKALAAGLEKNATLTSLDLGSNQIGDEGTQAFAEVIGKNTTLTTLVLRDNLICTVGAQSLAKVLGKNTTLTAFDLSSNYIGNIEAEALWEALYKNYTLTSLELGWNLIGNTQYRNINLLLAHNRQHRKKLQATVYEQLRLGRILLYKILFSGQKNNSILILSLKLREKVVKSLDENALLTEEQQRLILNYAEGKIAPVADKLSFFKATKCDRVRKHLNQDEIEAAFRSSVSIV